MTMRVPLGILAATAASASGWLTSAGLTRLVTAAVFANAVMFAGPAAFGAPLGVLLVSWALAWPASADELALPDWAAIFDAEGKLLDVQDSFGNPGANGIADYIDLYGADDAVSVQDNLSAGLAIDMTVLIDDDTLDNGTVKAARDIGHTYVMATRDAAGNRVVYAGIERLSLSIKARGWIDLYLYQDKVRVRQGAPWPIHREPRDGDLSVRIDLKGGAVDGIDVSVWEEGAYRWLEGIGVADGCGGFPGLLAACSAAAPIDGSQSELRDAEGNEVILEAEELVEVMVNSGALTGADTAFTSILVRTREDIALGSFAKIGAWSSASSSSGSGN